MTFATRGGIPVAASYGPEHVPAEFASIPPTAPEPRNPPRSIVAWAMSLVKPSAERWNAPPFPPRHAMRLAVDALEYSIRSSPEAPPIAIAGRVARGTAAQELAFLLRQGIGHVESARRRGLTVEELLPRLLFVFRCGDDFFEEIAKYDAARRLWAAMLRDGYGIDTGPPLQLTARLTPSAFPAGNPDYDAVRTSLQALGAAVSGVGLAEETPSSTSQVIAHETGVTAVADPFAGSWFVAHLTLELEARAAEFIRKVDEMGGMTSALEAGYPQAETARAERDYRAKVESGEAVVVGVNRFQNEGRERLSDRVAAPTPRAVGADAAALAALTELRQGAARDTNLIPLIAGAARACCTLGEICDALRDVFGTGAEPFFE